MWSYNHSLKKKLLDYKKILVVFHNFYFRIHCSGLSLFFSEVIELKTCKKEKTTN